MTLWKLVPRSGPDDKSCRQIIFVHASNEQNARKAATDWSKGKGDSLGPFYDENTYHAVRVEQDMINPETCDAVLQHLYPVCFCPSGEAPERGKNVK